MASWWPGALLGTWQYSAPRASAPGCSCVPPPPRWPGVSIPVIMFSTTIPDLGPGLPGGLRLGGHGSLQLHWEPHVLDLDPLHLDAPGLCSLLQSLLAITIVENYWPGWVNLPSFLWQFSPELIKFLPVSWFQEHSCDATLLSNQ